MRSAPVSSLRGIGPKSVALLDRLGITTVFDLALHLPFRYEDRTKRRPLGELANGDACLVWGRIVESSSRGRGGFVVRISDSSGSLNVRFIHSFPSQRQRLVPGNWLEAYGRVRTDGAGLEMIHPEWRVSTDELLLPKSEFRPIYHTVKGLSSARLRQLVRPSLSELNLLPVYSHDGLSLAEAVRIAHNPDPQINLRDVAVARKRIALDEMLGYQLVRDAEYRELKRQTTEPLHRRQGLGKQLLAHLGFDLTRAQSRVVKDVLEDLARERPMYRLVQGDVGSGKTVIAAFAALRACENGSQTAVMAPTELLAEQHHRTLSEWLSPLGIEVNLLLGKQPARVRRARARGIATGSDHVIIGTHALFQSSVTFNNLGLIIIDEQHRFGVHQRMQLRDKGRLPHQLVMTATPIPRTLTMSLYANMDVSEIDELPPGRSPVETVVQAPNRRANVIEGAERVLAGGGQVYWVVPAIQESDEPDLRSVDSVLDEIRQALPHRHSAGLHGKLSDAEKVARMERFRSGRVQLLVATTVVEVGVDVPNATLMVIDCADRMGLAQLHQLRGRVGRGCQQSFCVLLHDGSLSEEAHERLSVLVETNDGFEVAQRDLELRGWGDLLGAKQSGYGGFKVFDPLEHRGVIEEARTLCNELKADQAELALQILGTWAPGHREYTSA